MVVCAGIHMSDIPQFPYEVLWGERHLCSVPNLGIELIDIAPKIPIETSVVEYPMHQANEALAALRGDDQRRRCAHHG